MWGLLHPLCQQAMREPMQSAFTKCFQTKCFQNRKAKEDCQTGCVSLPIINVAQVQIPVHDLSSSSTMMMMGIISLAANVFPRLPPRKWNRRICVGAGSSPEAGSSLQAYSVGPHKYHNHRRGSPKPGELLSSYFASSLRLSPKTTPIWAWPRGCKDKAKLSNVHSADFKVTSARHYSQTPQLAYCMVL